MSHDVRDLEDLKKKQRIFITINPLSPLSSAMSPIRLPPLPPLLHRRHTLRTLLAILALPLLILTILSLRRPHTPPHIYTPRRSWFRSPDDSIVRSVHNETLGFGEIVMISLNTRTDRQDAISLIGSTTGVKVSKIIPAVNGETVHPKARPFGTAKDLLPPAYLGSWRSHMDAFRYIVDNKVETALVIEDDVDWDVYVKRQLSSFAKALRSSPLRPPLTDDERKRAPYGLDWDVIHLGTSRNVMAPPPHDNLFHVYRDPAATPMEMMEYSSPCSDNAFFCWYDIIKKTNLQPHERVVFPSYHPVGLVAIAVTYRGAQKMLYHLSWKELNNSMDFAVRDNIQMGRLRGWSVTPPIMSSWSNGGVGDSDLRNGGKGPLNPVDQGNMKGHSRGLAWSARRALTGQFDGDEYWKSDARWYGEISPPPKVGLVGNEEEKKEAEERERLEKEEAAKADGGSTVGGVVAPAGEGSGSAYAAAAAAVTGAASTDGTAAQANANEAAKPAAATPASNDAPKADGTTQVKSVSEEDKANEAPKPAAAAPVNNDTPKTDSTTRVKSVSEEEKANNNIGATQSDKDKEKEKKSDGEQPKTVAALHKSLKKDADEDGEVEKEEEENDGPRLNRTMVE